MVSKLSTFLFSVLFLSFYALNETHADDGQNPSDMSSIDAFTGKISEIMDSSGDGAAKFKELSKTFIPLMGIAEQVVANVAKFYNSTDKHDLAIAAIKLNAIYKKLEKYETVKFDSHDPRPTQYLTEDMKGAIWRLKSTINELIDVPINIVGRKVAVALDSNLTLLGAISGYAETYSPHLIGINLKVFASDIATIEIRNYGPSAVEYIYGQFHDVVLKLSFFNTICYAGAKVSRKVEASDVADAANEVYKTVITEFFNEADSKVKQALDESTRRTTEAAGN
ncbi:hypothetical protein DdX_19666 [Ditylenchus destructor]|uniref:Uncharacterized protein n=1 Tax=Ditylenchus destructor TaxID=166010 RepID=A0AAD4MHE1_9BILA|nr:hypothetical protein DdX_19666 [Ditylenchus destructor]